jgi:DnaJ-class molecular chaperone
MSSSRAGLLLLALMCLALLASVLADRDYYEVASFSCFSVEIHSKNTYMNVHFMRSFIFQLLGVSKKSTNAQIKKAYR